MNFSSIKIEDGSSFFSLGKRNAESFDQAIFNEKPNAKNFSRQSTNTDSTTTQKVNKNLKKCKTQGDKKKESLKKNKKRTKVETSKPYTFEKVQASPSQFYSRFEELLNFNSKLNQGLSSDVDGLEKNLLKLQNMSKGKSPKDQNSQWLNSLNPIKKINMGSTIPFDDIARKIQEQQSCKYSGSFSSMDTADGFFRPKEYPKTQITCQTAGFTIDNYSKKVQPQKSERTKQPKLNILEEISSLDGSIDREADMYSNLSEDEKNYQTLKNMLSDMKDFIGDCSRNNSSSISDDCDNTSISMFMNTKGYDELNDDDFSMKGFKPHFSSMEQSDMLDKGLGHFDSINFF